MYVLEPIKINKSKSISEISAFLNNILEKMILKMLINGFGHMIGGKIKSTKLIF